jgi:hypothetical protein
MRRCAYVLIIAAFALAACSRSADDKGKGGKLDTNAVSPGAEQLTDLTLKVASIDERLKKIEELLSEALNAPPPPPEPDPTAVYSVPIDGDPFVGPEDARITIVEAWDYS